MMKTEHVEIPPIISVGGVLIEVKQVERCEDNNLGECCTAKGEIEIADKWDGNKLQCQDSKRQTFYHEVVHCILDTMGENELSKNEKFVCTFSSFLNEAMRNARFIIMTESDETSKS